jgi:biopolymer transport protein ExbB/TolQ
LLALRGAAVLIPVPQYVKVKRSLLMAGIIVGALLMVSPVVGLMGTVFGMTRAFSVLGSSGVKDPQALSDSIGTTLVSRAVGFFLFPVGIVMFTLSLIFYLRLRYSSPPPLPRPPLQ